MQMTNAIDICTVYMHTHLIYAQLFLVCIHVSNLLSHDTTLIIYQQV